MKPSWESENRRPAESTGVDGVADNATLESLRDALRPAPLPAALVRRIETAWSAAPRGSRSQRLGWIAPALAAAALAAMFLLPSGVRPDRSLHGLVLSEEDANVVLAAFAAGRWYAPTDAVIDRLIDVVSELSTQLNPPSADDSSGEWDLPDTNESSPSPGTGRARSEPHAVL